MSLSPEHLTDLRRSGLTPATVEQMGAYSARPEDLNRWAGWDITSLGATSAIVFPYPDCNGFYQLKVFPTIQNRDGHQIKYIQPKGSESRVYILPSVRGWLNDPAEGVIVAEGVKKAARLAQEPFNVVGIPAVWNWKRGGDTLPYTDPACLIPDLVQLVVPGRRFFVCFDSDVWEPQKQDCRLGLYALMRHLEGLGAKVAAVRLPSPTKAERAEGITKIGADDYLWRHSLEDFQRLIVEAIPPTHTLFKTVAEQWDNKELATRSLAEPLDVLLAEPDEPLRFLIDRLMVAGASGWIGGEPKSLKSWLALYLILCIALGVPVFGKYPVPERARVLYLQEEDGRRRVRRRIRKILKGLGVEAPSGDFFRCAIKRGVLLDDKKWIAALRTELEEYRPALVVADVFELMHTKDSMERAELKPVFYALNRLQEEFGCGFLLVDHFKKSTQGSSKRGGQRLSGTVGKHAWGESSLYLFPGPRKNTVLVETELKDAQSEAFTLTLADTEDGGVIFEWAAEADTKADQMKVKILEAVETAGGRAEWVTTKAVAEGAGVSSNTAGKWLALLMDEDRKVERERRPVGKTTRVEWKLRA